MTTLLDSPPMPTLPQLPHIPPTPQPPPSREEQAKREIGVTDMSVGVQWILAAVFILAVVSVPVVQAWREWRVQGHVQATTILSAPRAAVAAYWQREGPWLTRAFTANNALLREMEAYETMLEDASVFGRAVRPTVQAWLTCAGVGNEKAYVGRDGWLFYRPDVDHVTGAAFLDPRQLAKREHSGSQAVAPPQPDPRQAILHFRRQLDARDIVLVLVPTPVKPTIEPERFAGQVQHRAIQNPSFAAFVREMEAAGVAVFDPTPLLLDAKVRTGESQYLTTDTHWTPGAMRLTAEALAAFLRERGLVGDGSAQPYHVEAVDVAGVGDIAAMLQLPDGQTLYPPQWVELEVVLTSGGEVWRLSKSSSVLVLGDSFSNIYSLGGMGWGDSAGFVEQLGFALQLPIDAILRNDAGAMATRQVLSRELAQGRDRLAGKRVVVWQFANRELSSGDWKLLDMTLGEAALSSFFVPEPGQTVRVTATVDAASPIPRPGSVPYKDHVFTVHLVDMEQGQAMVYLRSMTDGKLTEASRLRPGDRVTVDLRSWADVAERYDRFNRSELDDPMLQLEEPCWGEVMTP